MRLLDPVNNSPLHRVVKMVRHGAMIVAQLVDNVHQFEVSLTHDGERVLSVEPGWRRVPWTTCPQALQGIAGLVGQRLDGGPPPGFEKNQQCTHLYDLTKLAMAQALRGGDRRYDIEAWLMDSAEGVHMRVRRDEIEVLQLDAIDGRCITPGPLCDFSFLGPTVWPDASIDADLREALLLLRRAHLVFVESGPNRVVRRAVDLPQMAGACFTFQPERIAAALRPDAFHQYPAEDVDALVR